MNARPDGLRIDQADVLIHADELIVELSRVEACQDCVGGLGLLVMDGGDWMVIQLHTPPCVAMTSRAGKP